LRRIVAIIVAILEYPAQTSRGVGIVVIAGIEPPSGVRLVYRSAGAGIPVIKIVIVIAAQVEIAN
jgi:hypothetical protein